MGSGAAKTTGRCAEKLFAGGVGADSIGVGVFGGYPGMIARRSFVKGEFSLTLPKNKISQQGKRCREERGKYLRVTVTLSQRLRRGLGDRQFCRERSRSLHIESALRQFLHTS